MGSPTKDIEKALKTAGFVEAKFKNGQTIGVGFYFIAHATDVLVGYTTPRTGEFPAREYANGVLQGAG